MREEWGDQGYSQKNNMTEDQKRQNNLVFREIMQLTENWPNFVLNIAMKMNCPIIWH